MLVIGNNVDRVMIGFDGFPESTTETLEHRQISRSHENHNVLFGNDNLQLRVYTPQLSDEATLERIASQITETEWLFSFNISNYNNTLIKDNIQVFIYANSKEDVPLARVKDEDIIGVGILKWDNHVGVVYTNTMEYLREGISTVEDNPLAGTGENIIKNVYIGGAWVRPEIRGNGYYNIMFDHRLITAERKRYELEQEDSSDRIIITEPFGSVPEAGRGNLNISRGSSEAVRATSLKRGFVHAALSTEFDMGPTLFFRSSTRHEYNYIGQNNNAQSGGTNDI